MNRLAHAISWIVNPIMMPIVGLYYFLFYQTNLALLLNDTYRWSILQLVFILTVLLPILTLWLFKRLGWISGFNIPLRHQRPLPLMISTVYSFTAFYLIRMHNPVELINLILLAGVASMLVALLITLVYKHSIHLYALGSLLGMFVSIPGVPPLGIFVVIGLAGITGFARLQLNAHTPMQVFTGFVAGFCVPYFLFGIYH